MPNYPQHISHCGCSQRSLQVATGSSFGLLLFSAVHNFWAPSHAYISSFYLCSMYLNLFHWIEMLQTHSMSPWVRRVFIHLLPRLLIMKRPMKTMQMQRLILKLVIISISIIINTIVIIINIIVINNNITFRLGPHSVLIMGKQCNGGPEVVMG